MIINEQKIGYYGYAKVKYFKGNDLVKMSTISNNGTSLLFRLLAQAVCGENVQNSMPKYLDIGKLVTNNKQEYSTKLAYRINVEAKVIKTQVTTPTISNAIDVSQIAASFTAFVPSRVILATPTEQTDEKINCLRLYNNYDGTGDAGLLAQIDLATDEQISVQDSQQYSLMIEWTMTFGNMPKS